MLAVRELRLLHAELPLTRKFYFSDRRSGGGITSGLIGVASKFATVTKKPPKGGFFVGGLLAAHGLFFVFVGRYRSEVVIILITLRYMELGGTQRC